MTEVLNKVWRVRIKYDGEDYAEAAWTRNEVGLWYGAWTAQEFEDGILKHPHELPSFLSTTHTQAKLGWEIGKKFVNTVLRFRKISETDWVLVYLRLGHEIGLARVDSALLSEINHPLNKCGEIFKYRRIKDKKTFKILQLPDAYQLLPSQGQSNIHELPTMKLLVELLVKSETENDVWTTLKSKPFDELLDFLGASAWESFCFAYLILEEGFIPTGLSVGRTLPIADIVGRRKSDGAQIIAQCKKSNETLPIASEFCSLCENMEQGGVAYYFAYAGYCGEKPHNLKVIGRRELLSWIETSNGGRFRELIGQ